MTATLTALPWQRPLLKTLLDFHERNRLAHALLLHGQEGIGKRHLAQTLASMLLCATVDTTAAASCGICPSCVQWAAATHPDWLRIQPEENGPIRIDAVRAVSEFTSLRSHKAGYRIVVIERAEQLNRHAANALLKTLEEPPDGCLLILLSAWPGRLLATVRSRCLSLAMSKPPWPEALAWLKSQSTEANSSACEAALAIAAGGPLKALTLADDDALTRRARLFADFCQWAAQTSHNPSKEWHQGGPVDAIYWLQSWLSDLVKVSVSETDLEKNLLSNPDVAKDIQKLSQTRPATDWLKVHDMAQQLLSLTVSGNTTALNWELQFDAFFALAKPAR